VAALDLVVFDLAGTTIRDGGQVPAAFVAALAERGVGVTSDALRRVRGATKRQAIFEMLPESAGRAAEADAAYRSFQRHLARAYASGLEVVDGAEATFGRLRDAGIRFALTTGFDRQTTALLLDALGWQPPFSDGVVCGDDVARGRPAPYLIFRAMEAAGSADVRRVACIGDTALDLEAGWNAGAGWNIGVLSGAHDRARLEAAPHTHVIGSVADLAGVLGI